MIKDTRIYVGKVVEEDKHIETETEMCLSSGMEWTRIDDLFRMCKSGVIYRITIEPVEPIEEAIEELVPSEEPYPFNRFINVIYA